MLLTCEKHLSLHVRNQAFVPLSSSPNKHSFNWMFSTFQQIYPPHTHTRTSPQSYFLFGVRHQKMKDIPWEFSIIFFNPLIMLHPPLFLLYCTRSTKICYFSLHSLELHSKGNHMIRFRETNISRKKNILNPLLIFKTTPWSRVICIKFWWLTSLVKSDPTPYPQGTS